MELRARFDPETNGWKRSVGSCFIIISLVLQEGISKYLVVFLVDNSGGFHKRLNLHAWDPTELALSVAPWVRRPKRYLSPAFDVCHFCMTLNERPVYIFPGEQAHWSPSRSLVSLEWKLKFRLKTSSYDADICYPVQRLRRYSRLRNHPRVVGCFLLSPKSSSNYICLIASPAFIS